MAGVCAPVSAADASAIARYFIAVLRFQANELLKILHTTARRQWEFLVPQWSVDVVVWRRLNLMSQANTNTHCRGGPRTDNDCYRGAG